MRVLACVTQKGGAGKTTSAAGLAACAAEAGMRVLAVDTDAEQRSLTYWAELAGENSPFDHATELDPAKISAVTELGAEYDLVILDTPGTMGKPATQAALAVAEFVVLPSKPNILDLNPLVRTLREKVSPLGVPYRVLLTMVKKNSTADEEMAREFLARENVPVFKHSIRDSVHHGRAPALGIMATQFSAAGRAAADDYRRVTTEMFAEWARTSQTRQEK